MQKSCKNCQTQFLIEPDDFAFYEKINVPPPTLCPKCRYQRRMSWRNAWHLFKKRDARTGEMIFSAFPEESPVKIYDRDYWNTDEWDAMDYGHEYDFSRPFFSQFKELLHGVPIPAHSLIRTTNCRYCTNANGIKNCYLVRAATNTEDSAYVIWDHSSKQCYDSHMTTKCELGYGNVNTMRCYRTFFSVDCDDCTDVTLSKDCVGCNNCIGCVGLRSKSYCIFNEQLTKEEYAKRLAKLNLGSCESFAKLEKEAHAFWLKCPQKFIHGLKNLNVTGDYIYESKNAINCFRVQGLEDSKYCQNLLAGPTKNCYDYSNFGQNAELIYETLVAGEGVSNIKFSTQVYPNSKDIEYSAFCLSSSDLFGCVSLKKKQHCILNRQYSKEEYETLKAKIIAQMTRGGEYGEFFPSSLSPYPYQVTEAYEFFPLSDEQAKEKGFNVYSIQKQSYHVTLHATDMPDAITDADDTIVEQVIGCAHAEKCAQECTGAFRIVADELAFLRRMNFPLPRLCPNCRHYERLALRNSPHFYPRHCAKCNADIQTSYSPDRPEIVYCEQCYQNEVI